MVNVIVDKGVEEAALVDGSIITTIHSAANRLGFEGEVIGTDGRVSPDLIAQVRQQEEQTPDRSGAGGNSPEEGGIKKTSLADYLEEVDIGPLTTSVTREELNTLNNEVREQYAEAAQHIAEGVAANLANGRVPSSDINGEIVGGDLDEIISAEHADILQDAMREERAAATTLTVTGLNFRDLQAEVLPLLPEGTSERADAILGFLHETVALNREATGDSSLDIRDLDGLDPVILPRSTSGVNIEVLEALQAEGVQVVVGSPSQELDQMVRVEGPSTIRPNIDGPNASEPDMTALDAQISGIQALMSGVVSFSGEAPENQEIVASTGQGQGQGNDGVGNGRG